MQRENKIRQEKGGRDAGGHVRQDDYALRQKGKIKEGLLP